MRSVFAVLLGFGLCLVLASLFLTMFLNGRHVWTNDLARKYQAASQNYHAALHSAAHSHAEPSAPEPPPDDLDAARRDYEQYQSLLTKAQTQGPRAAGILRWTGIALCAVGLAGFLLSRQPFQESSSE
jgi:hypothetical protein